MMWPKGSLLYLWPHTSHQFGGWQTDTAFVLHLKPLLVQVVFTVLMAHECPLSLLSQLLINVAGKFLYNLQGPAVLQHTETEFILHMFPCVTILLASTKYHIETVCALASSTTRPSQRVHIGCRFMPISFFLNNISLFKTTEWTVSTKFYEGNLQ